MYKLVVFIDGDHLERVKDAIFSAGGGKIGAYDCCCFVSKGVGQFRPLAGSNPYLGEKGKVEEVDEYRLEVVVSSAQIKIVVEEMKKAHPYETPAYDVIKLEEL